MKGNMQVEGKNTRKSLYNKISGFLSVKLMFLTGTGVFVLLLLPLCYLSFVNRASGDDYGYGVFTRAAWVSSHSLIQVFKASIQTIQSLYYSWQGTWFSIFVFSLQPEVFSSHAYVITAFLMLFLLVGSSALLFKCVLVKKLGFDKWSCYFIVLMYLMLTIEFVPGIKSAFFWYNGTVHYMLPFAMCQLLAVLLMKYIETYKVKYFIGITILMTLLGGSNYQASLFALIAAFYAGVSVFLPEAGIKIKRDGIRAQEKVIGKKEYRVFLLVVPVILEMAGLVVSMKAPGNNVRAGGNFGFSVSDGFVTVGISFLQGILDIVGYYKEKPVIFIGLLILFLIMLEALGSMDGEKHIKHPVLSCIALYCLYSAMQAPAIYAGVEVSLGVYNMNYQVFLLMMIEILMALADKGAGIIKKRRKLKALEGKAQGKILTDGAWIHKTIVLPGLLICAVLLFVCRSNIKQSTSYICFQYIASGQAADFKEQMDLQTSLLLDENVSDVVVPFINDEQGPLMHMPVTEDKNAWTNTVTSNFYVKKSVTAMPRDEWLKIYGKEEE
ncbi:MAG: hypothetical protein J5988_05745 [Eubacterium sp.]|nr:hypothetical protein [Eubacterium sp.]